MTRVPHCPRVRLACVAAAVALGTCHVPALAERAQQTGEHESHAPVSPDERALRRLLVLYGNGDINPAVSALLDNSPQWSGQALDAAARRIDEDIKYHRRPQNRLSVARDERLERYRRGERLRVLLLAAALQLEAARAVTAVDTVGAFLVESERTLDRLYALRRDLEENGAVPWPVGLAESREDEPGDNAPERTADWPQVRTWAARWYSAAIARLQQLVELRLAPALIARGLARFPADPELLLARGSSVETRLALSRVDASLASSLYSSDVRRRWRGELSDAERDFERAVDATGPASEVAVRLARVRLLQGQAGRARDLLNRVLAAGPRAEIRYLALLFRAAASEHAGDVPAATDDYEAALAHMPGTQTPMLALARIADEQNQPAVARNWIERAVAGDALAVDPWRRYIQGQAWQLEPRMAAVRTLDSR